MIADNNAESVRLDKYKKSIEERENQLLSRIEKVRIYEKNLLIKVRTPAEKILSEKGYKRVGFGVRSECNSDGIYKSICSEGRKVSWTLKLLSKRYVYLTTRIHTELNLFHIVQQYREKFH